MPNPPNPSSKANKRRAHERMADLVLIEQWYVRGMGPRMIAAKLAEIRPYRISRQQIQADLRKLDAMWKAEAIATRDQHKRKVLAEIEDCYRECVAAWERSKADAVRKMVEKSGTADDATKQRMQSEAQCGDPRFLAEMRELRNQKIKLLGLDEPTSVELSGAISTVHLSRDEALERMFAQPTDVPIHADSNGAEGNGARTV